MHTVDYILFKNWYEQREKQYQDLFEPLLNFLIATAADLHFLPDYSLLSVSGGIVCSELDNAWLKNWL